MAGDVVRRLVARTMSQQLMDGVQQATVPFQYAKATKAGCECISHVLQALMELNVNATILSVDGVSACVTEGDVVLQGLSNVERVALPFASMFLWCTVAVLLGGRFWHGSHHRPRGGR